MTDGPSDGTDGARLQDIADQCVAGAFLVGELGVKLEEAGASFEEGRDYVSGKAFGSRCTQHW